MTYKYCNLSKAWLLIGLLCITFLSLKWNIDKKHFIAFNITHIYLKSQLITAYFFETALCQWARKASLDKGTMCLRTYSAMLLISWCWGVFCHPAVHYNPNGHLRNFLSGSLYTIRKKPLWTNRDKIFCSNWHVPSN